MTLRERQLLNLATHLRAPLRIEGGRFVAQRESADACDAQGAYASAVLALWAHEREAEAQQGGCLPSLQKRVDAQRRGDFLAARTAVHSETSPNLPGPSGRPSLQKRVSQARMKIDS